MKKYDHKHTNGRRNFLGSVASGAAAIGIATLVAPISLHANRPSAPAATTADPDAWFSQLKGKHRIMFDATRPNGIFPFAWPKVFLLTNAASGTAEKDCNAIVVLRHDAIVYALEDKLWAKYKLGEHFKTNDHRTNAPAVRNIFWKPTPGEFSVPGIGPVPIGINELQDSGVMFCVCDMALTVHSATLAGDMNMDAAAVKKEWTEGLLPGIQLVPSGVWAIGRAQEHGCGYCFAG
jgi:intracellular sulfur oxidation DsrE/DsrF family protein